MKPPAVRLPFGPLRRFLGPCRVEGGPVARTKSAHREQPYNNHYLAELAGVSLRTITRWHADGIPLERADALAATIGAHPLEIWTWADYFREGGTDDELESVA